MEMGGQAAITTVLRSQERQQCIIYLSGFYAPQTESSLRHRIQKARHQHTQGCGLSQVLTIMADVDASESKLRMVLCQLPGLGKDGLRQARPTLAPGEPGRAKAALPVAPILDLEPTTGPGHPPLEQDGGFTTGCASHLKRGEPWGIGDGLQGESHRLWVMPGDDSGGSYGLSITLGGSRRRAPSHNNREVGLIFPETTNEAGSLCISAGGHGACIDDNSPRILRVLGHLPSGPFQFLTDSLRIVLVSSASKGDEMDASPLLTRPMAGAQCLRAP
jgi:hypothetical protein